MKVTDVKIRITYGGTKISAVAMIVLDDSLIINDIDVIDMGKKIIVQLPRAAYAKRNRMESVVPMTGELRYDINNSVCRAYKQALQKRTRVRF